MIIPFESKHTAELIDLFKLNCPAGFSLKELPEFELFLKDIKGLYYVLVANGKIVGSGGIEIFEDEFHAKLGWDMIHPDYHFKGLGSKLYEHKIEAIHAENKGINHIKVRTSQMAFKFYEKLGYQLTKVSKDYWADGYDLYEMEKKYHK